MNFSREEIKSHYQNNSDALFSFLNDFLKFKTIATDPAYHKECRNCANWLVEQLGSIGFEARLIETSGQPCLFAVREGKDDRPKVLFYGHYDVQPVDPIKLWDTDPFEPTVKDGEIFARGAVDNKGQVAFVIEALRVLIEKDLLDCTVKILLEGEEESGSGGLGEIINDNLETFDADVLVVCDTGTRTPTTPTLTMGLKGIISLRFDIGGLSMDLHSGVFGGLINAPAREVARVLSSLHDENGKVAVPGFYDDVVMPSEDGLKKMNAFPMSQQEFEHVAGVPFEGGEKGYSMLELMGARPNIEINGVHSGYAGKGGKTIVPQKASALISSRIVEGQDPKKIIDLLKTHIRNIVADELEVSFPYEEGVGGCLSLSTDSKWIQRTATMLSSVFETEPEYFWLGASIPILAELTKATKKEAILVGFGLESNCAHAPNEHFSLEQFENGFLYACSLFQEFSKA